MKEIQLTQGQVAIVDDADYEWLNQWKWYAAFYKHHRGYYAVRQVHEDGERRQRTQSMHRLIMGVTDPKILVDHRNRDSLDNRRNNLRVATPSRNSANSRKRDNTTSRYKGVSYAPEMRTRKWQAQGTFGKKHVSLGFFENELDAALAYQRAAQQYHGEFAYTPGILDGRTQERYVQRELFTEATA